MSIEIDPLEVMVLKKLVLINHALAKQLSGSAGREQASLVRVLNDITLRADLANQIPAHSLQQREGQS
jgi:hypothetical protein